MSVDTDYDNIKSELQTIRNELKGIMKLIRKIRATQEDPTGEKSRQKAANNGFNRKISITPDFASFLGIDKSEKISRSDGTRRVSAYIKENNLNDPNNGRVIIPNDRLRKLLNIDLNEELTFLNIQKYLSKHYLKTPPTTETPPPEAASDESVKKVVTKRPPVRKTAVKV